MLASGYTLLGVLGFPSYATAERAAIDKRANGLTHRPHGPRRRSQPATCLMARSAGSRSRAPCAREPVLLCLDEPAAGLNPRESAELNELLLTIRKQHAISILLIEHDMSVVMEISDHMVVLDYGVKIADGPPADSSRQSKSDRGLSRCR